MKAFDGNWRDHFALLKVGECCGAIWGLGEVGGIGLLKTSEKVDLSQGELDSCIFISAVSWICE